MERVQSLHSMKNRLKQALFSPFGVLVGRFGRNWAHKKRRRFPEYVRFCEA
jgi:hypothetical protein